MGSYLSDFTVCRRRVWNFCYIYIYIYTYIIYIYIRILYIYIYVYYIYIYIRIYLNSPFFRSFIFRLKIFRVN